MEFEIVCSGKVEGLLIISLLKERESIEDERSKSCIVVKDGDLLELYPDEKLSDEELDEIINLLRKERIRIIFNVYDFPEFNDTYDEILEDSREYFDDVKIEMKDIIFGKRND